MLYSDGIEFGPAKRYPGLVGVNPARGGPSSTLSDAPLMLTGNELGPGLFTGRTPASLGSFGFHCTTEFITANLLSANILVFLTIHKGESVNFASNYEVRILIQFPH